MEWGRFFATFFGALVPMLPQLCLIALIILFATCPIPGRGPRLFQPLDPLRRFNGETRRTVMSRAGGRCEGSIFLAWGRCRDEAGEADHVYPHSRGGPTTLANGQALCRGHNRSKAAMRPPWWYLRALERRRRSYFPAGTEVRVSAAISDAELAEHAAAVKRRTTR